MELSKILLYNSAMHPPMHEDLECWVSFRKFVNRNVHIKGIVKHWLFNTIVAILIVLGAINAIFVLFPRWGWSEVLDKVFVWIFFVEIVLRIIGIGPSKFFS